MKRFSWSLKHQWTDFKVFADIKDRTTGGLDCIEGFNNNVRLHQSFKYKTPNQVEEEFVKKTSGIIPFL